MDVPIQLAQWADLAANMATALGIPVAIALFIYQRSKDRTLAEMDTYKTMHSIYSEHIRLCIQHPEIFYDVEMGPKGADQNELMKDLFLDLVVNMLEAAYFTYRYQNTEFKKSQWEGWNVYMRHWCKDSRLLARWDVIMLTYDSKFVAHMKMLRAQVEGTALVVR